MTGSVSQIRRSSSPFEPAKVKKQSKKYLYPILCECLKISPLNSDIRLNLKELVNRLTVREVCHVLGKLEPSQQKDFLKLNTSQQLQRLFTSRARKSYKEIILSRMKSHQVSLFASQFDVATRRMLVLFCNENRNYHDWKMHFIILCGSLANEELCELVPKMTSVQKQFAIPTLRNDLLPQVFPLLQNDELIRLLPLLSPAQIEIALATIPTSLIVDFVKAISRRYLDFSTVPISIKEDTSYIMLVSVLLGTSERKITFNFNRMNNRQLFFVLKLDSKDYAKRLTKSIDYYRLPELMEEMDHSQRNDVFDLLETDISILLIPSLSTDVLRSCAASLASRMSFAQLSALKHEQFAIIASKLTSKAVSEMTQEFVGIAKNSEREKKLVNKAPNKLAIACLHPDLCHSIVIDHFSIFKKEQAVRCIVVMKLKDLASVYVRLEPQSEQKELIREFIPINNEFQRYRQNLQQAISLREAGEALNTIELKKCYEKLISMEKKLRPFSLPHPAPKLMDYDTIKELIRKFEEIFNSLPDQSAIFDTSKSSATDTVDI